MPRIRTIKPEFPQSESIGRLSRDARLLFIQLWTLADDTGRTRASSRGLASLLYPFDDDARDLIDGWLAELARENKITLYEVDGARYLEICKWLEHQKIDRPSKSKFPEPREGSRVLDDTSTHPREKNLRTKEGTKDQGEDHAAASPPVREGDIASIVFDSGARFLEVALEDRQKARALLGKWKREYGEEAVIAAIGRCQRAGAAEPISYIVACLQDRLKAKQQQAPPNNPYKAAQPG